MVGFGGVRDGSGEEWRFEFLEFNEYFGKFINVKFFFWLFKKLRLVFKGLSMILWYWCLIIILLNIVIFMGCVRLRFFY